MVATDALATVEQLTARTGITYTESSDPTLAQAEAALEDASDLVRAEGLDDWSAATAPPAIVKLVLRMARRGMDNPNGYTSETYGSYTYRLRDELATGVWLNNSEIEFVQRVAAQSTSSAYTVQLRDDAFACPPGGRPYDAAGCYPDAGGHWR